MGIFDGKVGVFATYRAELVFRDRIMGGTPKDHKVIEAWLRGIAGVSQKEEVRRGMIRTMQELGADVTEESTFEELEAASAKLAQHRQTNGFKRDAEGLYIEQRQVKAMFKENTNILFAGGDGWGPTKKGARNYVAERVFVNPDRIHLGVQEPTGVDLFIGHTTGPSGPQSNLTYYEYVEKAHISFDVLVTQDGVLPDDWAAIWVQSQEGALGSLRSQGFGRFDIVRFELITPSTMKTPKKTTAAQRAAMDAERFGTPVESLETATA